MNRQRQYDPTRRQPADNPDRDAEIEELSFNDDEPPRRAGDRRSAEEIAQEQSPQRVREAGMTGGERLEKDRTADDLTPDNLFKEDGARSPSERGRGAPADQRLRAVDEDEIGGGDGLDEAELGRVDPLDGKPWDGER